MNLSKKQSGFAPPLVILIAVILIIAGGAGYYFYRTSVDETADWNVYQNEKYGFEMRYPKEWRIEEAVITDLEKAKPVESVFGFSPKDKVYYHMAGGATYGTIDPISIEISRGSMEEYQNRYPGVSEAKKVLIGDNLSALYWENALGEIFYVFENPNNNIVITLRSEIDMISYQLEPSEIEELKNIFNQILSTFKFIESEGAKEEKEETVVVPNVPMMLDLDTEATTGSPYTIGWKTVSEATNYILERDTNSSFSNPIVVSSRTLNSFSGTLSPLVSTRYYFRVKACNKYGCSSWSKTTMLWVEVPVEVPVVLETPETSADCEKIVESGGKENCYFQVAIETKNRSLCEKITDSVKKDQCLEFFRREAKKLMNEALLKIEKTKTEEDPQKLLPLIAEAVEDGKRAVEFDPKNPKILFQMGNIYFEIKESVSDADVWAKYYYKKALELDPNNPLYQEKLREIQSQDD